jgi:tRNA(His) 5'-end guanylyltransferase
VDYDLHNHMPNLKIDVFMPAILLPEGVVEGPVRTYWLNRPDNEQPWDHMNESAKRQTWEYFRKVTLAFCFPLTVSSSFPDIPFQHHCRHLTTSGTSIVRTTSVTTPLPV